LKFGQFYLDIRFLYLRYPADILDILISGCPVNRFPARWYPLKKYLRDTSKYYPIISGQCSESKKLEKNAENSHVSTESNSRILRISAGYQGLLYTGYHELLVSCHPLGEMASILFSHRFTHRFAKFAGKKATNKNKQKKNGGTL